MSVLPGARARRASSAWSDRIGREPSERRHYHAKGTASPQPLQQQHQHAPPVHRHRPEKRRRTETAPAPQRRERAAVPKAVQYTFTDAFTEIVEEKRTEARTRRFQHAVPIEKWRYYLPGARKASSTVTGDQRVRDLRAALSRLDGLGFRRTMHQIAFHEAFIGACIAQVYGDDLQRNLVRILEENGFDELASEIAVVCPRRWGKTTAVALYVAAFMYTQPDAEICIYSVAKRASSMMLQKIFMMVRKLSGDDLTIITTYNQEELRIKTINGREAVARSYPSNAN